MGAVTQKKIDKHNKILSKINANILRLKREGYVVTADQMWTDKKGKMFVEHPRTKEHLIVGYSQDT